MSLKTGIGGVIGKSLFPAVYCAGGWAGGGASFSLSTPNRLSELEQDGQGTAMVMHGPHKVGMGEIRTRYVKEALRKHGVWGDEADETASYAGLFNAIDRTVDFELVR